MALPVIFGSFFGRSGRPYPWRFVEQRLRELNASDDDVEFERRRYDTEVYGQNYPKHRLDDDSVKADTFTGRTGKYFEWDYVAGKLRDKGAKESDIEAESKRYFKERFLDNPEWKNVPVEQRQTLITEWDRMAGQKYHEGYDFAAKIRHGLGRGMATTGGALDKALDWITGGSLSKSGYSGYDALFGYSQTPTDRMKQTGEELMDEAKMLEILAGMPESKIEKILAGASSFAGGAVELAVPMLTTAGVGAAAGAAGRIPSIAGQIGRLSTGMRTLGGITAKGYEAGLGFAAAEALKDFGGTVEEGEPGLGKRALSAFRGGALIGVGGAAVPAMAAQTRFLKGLQKGVEGKIGVEGLRRLEGGKVGAVDQAWADELARQANNLRKYQSAAHMAGTFAGGTSGALLEGADVPTALLSGAEVALYGVPGLLGKAKPITEEQFRGHGLREYINQERKHGMGLKPYDFDTAVQLATTVELRRESARDMLVRDAAEAGLTKEQRLQAALDRRGEGLGARTSRESAYQYLDEFYKKNGRMPSPRELAEAGHGTAEKYAAEQLMTEWTLDSGKARTLDQAAAVVSGAVRFIEAGEKITAKPKKSTDVLFEIHEGKAKEHDPKDWTGVAGPDFRARIFKMFDEGNFQDAKGATETWLKANKYKGDKTADQVVRDLYEKWYKDSEGDRTRRAEAAALHPAESKASESSLAPGFENPRNKAEFSAQFEKSLTEMGLHPNLRSALGEYFSTLFENTKEAARQLDPEFDEAKFWKNTATITSRNKNSVDLLMTFYNNYKDATLKRNPGMTEDRAREISQEALDKYLQGFFYGGKGTTLLLPGSDHPIATVLHEMQGHVLLKSLPAKLKWSMINEFAELNRAKYLEKMSQEADFINEMRGRGEMSNDDIADYIIYGQGSRPGPLAEEFAGVINQAMIGGLGRMRPYLTTDSAKAFYAVWEQVAPGGGLELGRSGTLAERFGREASFGPRMLATLSTLVDPSRAKAVVESLGQNVEGESAIAQIQRLAKLARGEEAKPGLPEEGVEGGAMAILTGGKRKKVSEFARGLLGITKTDSKPIDVDTTKTASKTLVDFSKQKKEFKDAPLGAEDALKTAAGQFLASEEWRNTPDAPGLRARMDVSQGIPEVFYGLVRLGQNVPEGLRGSVREDVRKTAEARVMLMEASRVRPVLEKYLPTDVAKEVSRRIGKTMLDEFMSGAEANKWASFDPTKSSIPILLEEFGKLNGEKLGFTTRDIFNVSSGLEFPGQIGPKAKFRGNEAVEKREFGIVIDQKKGQNAPSDKVIAMVNSALGELFPSPFGQRSNLQITKYKTIDKSGAPTAAKDVFYLQSDGDGPMLMAIERPKNKEEFKGRLRSAIDSLADDVRTVWKTSDKDFEVIKEVMPELYGDLFDNFYKLNSEYLNMTREEFWGHTMVFSSREKDAGENLLEAMRPESARTVLSDKVRMENIGGMATFIRDAKGDIQTGRMKDQLIVFPDIKMSPLNTIEHEIGHTIQTALHPFASHAFQRDAVFFNSKEIIDIFQIDLAGTLNAHSALDRMKSYQARGVRTPGELDTLMRRMDTSIGTYNIAEIGNALGMVLLRHPELYEQYITTPTGKRIVENIKRLNAAMAASRGLSFSEKSYTDETIRKMENLDGTLSALWDTPGMQLRERAALYGKILVDGDVSLNAKLGMLFENFKPLGRSPYAILKTALQTYKQPSVQTHGAIFGDQVERDKAFRAEFERRLPESKLMPDVTPLLAGLQKGTNKALTPSIKMPEVEVLPPERQFVRAESPTKRLMEALGIDPNTRLEDIGKEPRKVKDVEAEVLPEEGIEGGTPAIQGVPPDRQLTVNIGMKGPVDVEFADPRDKDFFALRAKVRAQMRSRYMGSGNPLQHVQDLADNFFEKPSQEVFQALDEYHDLVMGMAKQQATIPEDQRTQVKAPAFPLPPGPKYQLNMAAAQAAHQKAVAAQQPTTKVQNAQSAPAPPASQKPVPATASQAVLQASAQANAAPPAAAGAAGAAPPASPPSGGSGAPPGAVTFQGQGVAASAPKRPRVKLLKNGTHVFKPAVGHTGTRALTSAGEKQLAALKKQHHGKIPLNKLEALLDDPAFAIDIDSPANIARYLIEEPSADIEHLRNKLGKWMQVAEDQFGHNAAGEILAQVVWDHPLGLQLEIPKAGERGILLPREMGRDQLSRMWADNLVPLLSNIRQAFGSEGLGRQLEMGFYRLVDNENFHRSIFYDAINQAVYAGGKKGAVVNADEMRQLAYALHTGDASKLNPKLAEIHENLKKPIGVMFAALSHEGMDDYANTGFDIWRYMIDKDVMRSLVQWGPNSEHYKRIVAETKKANPNMPDSLIEGTLDTWISSLTTRDPEARTIIAEQLTADAATLAASPRQVDLSKLVLAPEMFSNNLGRALEHAAHSVALAISWKRNAPWVSATMGMAKSLVPRGSLEFQDLELLENMMQHRSPGQHGFGLETLSNVQRFLTMSALFGKSALANPFQIGSHWIQGTTRAFLNGIRNHFRYIGLTKGPQPLIGKTGTELGGVMWNPETNAIIRGFEKYHPFAWTEKFVRQTGMQIGIEYIAGKDGLVQRYLSYKSAQEALAAKGGDVSKLTLEQRNALKADALAAEELSKYTLNIQKLVDQLLDFSKEGFTTDIQSDADIAGIPAELFYAAAKFTRNSALPMEQAAVPKTWTTNALMRFATSLKRFGIHQFIFNRRMLIDPILQAHQTNANYRKAVADANGDPVKLKKLYDEHSNEMLKQESRLAQAKDRWAKTMIWAPLAGSFIQSVWKAATGDWDQAAYVKMYNATLGSDEADQIESIVRAGLESMVTAGLFGAVMEGMVNLSVDNNPLQNSTTELFGFNADRIRIATEWLKTLASTGWDTAFGDTSFEQGSKKIASQTVMEAEQILPASKVLTRGAAGAILGTSVRGMLTPNSDVTRLRTKLRDAARRQNREDFNRYSQKLMDALKSKADQERKQDALEKYLYGSSGGGQSPYEKYLDRTWTNRGETSAAGR